MMSGDFSSTLVAFTSSRSISGATLLLPGLRTNRFCVDGSTLLVSPFRVVFFCSCSWANRLSILADLLPA